MRLTKFDCLTPNENINPVLIKASTRATEVHATAVLAKKNIDHEVMDSNPPPQAINATNKNIGPVLTAAIPEIKNPLC